MFSDSHDNTEKGIWSIFTLSKQSQQENNSKDDATDMSWDTILPPSCRFHDLVLYLEEQEHEIINLKLQNLARNYETFLIKGDAKLSEARNDIFNVVTSLCTGVDSLQEIYQSVLNGKLEKYDLYNEWEAERENIEGEINRIIEDSVEGRNYQSLISESRNMELKIRELEEKLLILKQKKKLIDHQVLETKSLLDIKLNKLKDKLNNLLEDEKSETALLFKEKQILFESSKDSDVKKALKLDIERINTILQDLSERKSNFEGFRICLKDVFDTLNNVEASMCNLIREEKSEHLEQLLVSTRIHLFERLDLIKKYHVPYGEKLIKDEISAIEKGIELLHSAEKVKLSRSPESKDMNYATVNSNVHQTEITKLLPSSPPKASPTRLTTSNFTATPTARSDLNFKSDSNIEKLRKEIIYFKKD